MRQLAFRVQEGRILGLGAIFRPVPSLKGLGRFRLIFPALPCRAVICRRLAARSWVHS